MGYRKWHNTYIQHKLSRMKLTGYIKPLLKNCSLRDISAANSKVSLVEEGRFTKLGIG